MWLALITIVLAFAACMVVIVQAAEMNARAALIAPFAVLYAVLAILTVMFSAALFLLAVDAARKLRSIDQKLDERP
jgi:hypothetical protein